MGASWPPTVLSPTPQPGSRCSFPWNASLCTLPPGMHQPHSLQAPLTLSPPSGPPWCLPETLDSWGGAAGRAQCILVPTPYLCSADGDSHLPLKLRLALDGWGQAGSWGAEHVSCGVSHPSHAALRPGSSHLPDTTLGPGTCCLIELTVRVSCLPSARQDPEAWPALHPRLDSTARLAPGPLPEPHSSHGEAAPVSRWPERTGCRTWEGRCALRIRAEREAGSG